jgi:phosphoglucomutase
MMLSYKIKGIDTFINIEDTYYGGSQNIIDETSSLGGFSKSESSGFFSLTDILIYELNKYSNSLGTIGKNNLTLEEYSNLLRNYIDSQAYRFLGFISVNAIEKFIERFSVIRRIKLQTYVNRNLVSLAIFKKFIIDALLKDHPIILQIGKNRNKDYPKYSIIVGIEDESLILSMNGEKRVLNINNIFDYNDIELGLLYMEVLNVKIDGNDEEEIKMDYMVKFEEWLNSEYIDDKTKEELKALVDEEEIEDRFYQDLEFGTAGLRGKIGAGTNRMNNYTVGLSTQALAQVISSYGQESMDKGVAIAYDVRNFSKEFSQVASAILAANGIKVYLFEDIRPTPMLSYAVRKLKTQSGIVITASHNPKEYNGYKVYWEEGSQILDEHADQILDALNNLDFSDINWGNYETSVQKGEIEILGEELDNEYYKEVLNMSIREDIDKGVSIVYSPLNGTGYIPVTTILEKRGFNNVHVVEEQRLPDGDFSTVGYPNPEDVKAFEFAKKLAKEVDGDVIIATDPDCDRVAMMGKDFEGEYFAFNGNQTGVLLINYILNGLAEKGEIPENGAIVKSLVTGEMAKPICEKFGVSLFNTLTGFKNICSLPNEWDNTGEYKFIFGYEESIGYTYGDYVRDKDAVVSSMMIAEMAGYYKSIGKTLYEVLYELYEEYGYYKERLISLTLEGVEGQARIKRMMDSIREEPVKTIGSMELEKVTDYLTDDPIIGVSNVLKYELNDGSWYVVRPSGTEPKIKLYIYAKDKSEEKSQEKIKEIEETILERMNSVE